jgi:hypothetical protein
MTKRGFKRVAVFASVATLAGGAGAPTDMAANLAKELGLSESKVAAALKKLMPQGGPPNGQPAPSVTPSATTTS